MPSSTLTSKGQTTIPKEVRDHLKLQSGDQIDFVIQENGTVLLRPATIHVRELKDTAFHRCDERCHSKTFPGTALKALDTNVLVRYLVQDDPGQSRRAAAYIEGAASAGDQILLSNIVLCETVQVLDSA